MASRPFAVLAIVSLGAGAFAWDSLQAEKAPPQQAPVDFTRDIQPILEAQCYECHGPKKSKADLRLDGRGRAMEGGETGAAIVPGNSEKSLIVRRVLGLDGDDRMPKDEEPLTAAQIALIRTWIDQGALWPEAAARGSGQRPKSPSTGPTAGPRVRRCRRFALPTGRATRSTASSWRASKKKD